MKRGAQLTRQEKIDVKTAFRHATGVEAGRPVYLDKDNVPSLISPYPPSPQKPRAAAAYHPGVVPGMPPGYPGYPPMPGPYPAYPPPQLGGPRPPPGPPPTANPGGGALRLPALPGGNPQAEVCMDWKAGKCTRDACRFRHS